MTNETLEIIENLSKSVESLKEEVKQEKQLTHGDRVRHLSNRWMVEFFYDMLCKELTVKKLTEFLDKPYIAD